MPRVSPALGRALAARRAALNAHFRRHGRGVDPGAFADYLARTVDPVVAALALGDDAAAERVATALFELGIPAMKRGLAAGGEGTAFQRALREALPQLAPRVAEEPRRLVAAIGNAWDQIATGVSERAADSWLRRFAASAPRFPGEALYDAGLVLAWAHGLAEAREAALAKLGRMAPEDREALVGAREVDPARERRFAALGSRGELGPVEVVARVGGFVGFGGPFVALPEVYAVEGRVYATDGDVTRELHADVFGARLVRTGMSSLAVLEKASRSPALADAELRALERPASVASVPGLGAATFKTSYYVFVLGRREARA